MPTTPPTQPTPAAPRTIRDTLFGDTPLNEWGLNAGNVSPWSEFAAARAALAKGDQRAALTALGAVVDTVGLEARHYLVAWQAMRELGVAVPATHAKQVLGVVVEVAVENGVDLVAAYADGSARYYNFTGAGVVIDTPPPQIRTLVDNLIAAAVPVVQLIGPWDKPRLGPPTGDGVRVNFLTPSGLHFGQGAFYVFSQDRMAGPVIEAAFVLMQALMELGKRK
ncbi:MAG: hypothetical protein ACREJO_05030 [Phycisphaerales bacterium]